MEAHLRPSKLPVAFEATDEATAEATDHPDPAEDPAGEDPADEVLTVPTDPTEPSFEDDFSDSILDDSDPAAEPAADDDTYREFLALEQEIISQGGPTKGQIKKNVDTEKAQRYNELRDLYQSE